MVRTGAQQRYSRTEKGMTAARIYARLWRKDNPDRARKASRDAYWRDPERARQIARRSYQKLRASIIIKLGGKCVACGETDRRVLQINHRRGGGRKELEDGKADNLYRAIRNETVDLSQFDVRCANCNIIFEYEMARRSTE